VTDLIKKTSPEQTSRSSGGEPVMGRWYWLTVTDTDVETKTTRRVLCCVIHVGSNFVKLEGPAHDDGETSTFRVHFDSFWELCEYVDDPDPIIDGQIERHKQESSDLMNEVRRVTALLGVSQRGAISEAGNSEVQALSVRTSEPTEQYKSALVKAQKETLPYLFKKLEDSNKALGQWMKVKIIPMKAEAHSLNGLVSLVEDRIFSVELYAGLVESVEQVRRGEPAANDEPVHLMQRRCYMDEECLVGYEHGGMDYKNIGDFEKWLCKPKNFSRIFPFPRTFVAFRVRREDKEREVNLGNFIQVMNEKKWDKATFLYIRNGERLYRMETEIEFEEKLFPDTNHKLFTSQKLWTRHASCTTIDSIISDEELQGIIEDEKQDEIKKAKMPKKEQWHFHRSHIYSSDSYTEFTPASVYYDDIAAVIAAERKKHNRLALIMQGLLDRSPVLTPHPPWQLWTNEGFAAAFRLHYDATRALSDGDRPDFEAYRAKLNSYLTSGSITVGQKKVWMMREAVRENERRSSMHSYGGSDRYSEKTYYEPDGDPGPGKLARVDRYNASAGTCTYEWKRQKRGRSGYAIAGTEIGARLVTGEENVMNVDAYRPGDFLIFFNDPRTRQEYLRWAPILLEAEECHAGNRKGFKPARALPPQHKVVVRTEERPLDLAVPKPPKPRPSIGEEWEGRKVRIRRAMSTKGGTKFKAGEVLVVSYYHRKKINLYDEKEKSRGIHNVELYEVDIVSEAPTK
jgi:hypothetical protein